MSIDRGTKGIPMGAATLGGGGGTTDYTALTNKPQINSVELTGNKTSADLGLQPAGDYALSSEIPVVDTLVGGENITLSRDLTDSDSGSGTLTIDTKDRLTLTSGITINGSDGMNKMYMYPSYLTCEYTPDPTNAPTDKKSLSIKNSGISYNDSSLGTYGMNATLIGIQNINSKHHISLGNPARDFPGMPPMEGEVTPDEMILFSKGKSIIVAEGSYSVSENPSYVALKEDIIEYIAGNGVELVTPSTGNAYSQQINIVPATASTIGGVKPDGTTITVDASGTLSVSSLETRIAALEARVTALEGGTA